MNKQNKIKNKYMNKWTFVDLRLCFINDKTDNSLFYNVINRLFYSIISRNDKR